MILSSNLTISVLAKINNLHVQLCSTIIKGSKMQARSCIHKWGYGGIHRNLSLESRERSFKEVFTVGVVIEQFLDVDYLSFFPFFFIYNTNTLLLTLLTLCTYWPVIKALKLLSMKYCR